MLLLASRGLRLHGDSYLAVNSNLKPMKKLGASVLKIIILVYFNKNDEFRRFGDEMG